MVGRGVTSDRDRNYDKNSTLNKIHLRKVGGEQGKREEQGVGSFSSPFPFLLTKEDEYVDSNSG